MEFTGFSREGLAFLTDLAIAYYPGQHVLVFQINGTIYAQQALDCQSHIWRRMVHRSDATRDMRSSTSYRRIALWAHYACAPTVTVPMINLGVPSRISPMRST
jgi:hypothetical protein